MRGPERLVLAALLLSLLATGSARAAEGAPGAAAAAGEDSAWGVVVRSGYFGLPDVIADELFYQHPKVSGWAYGAEIRYHGSGGRLGIASAGLAIDVCTADGEGVWQTEESSSPKARGGEIKLLAATFTGYWTAFPSWTVHPYLGLGIGLGYFEGKLLEDNEKTEVSVLLPVLHVPVGLAVELGERVQLALEARIFDGVQAGGALQLRF